MKNILSIINGQIKSVYTKGEKIMNNNDSKPSKGSKKGPHKSTEKKAGESATPTPPPLSSPKEPTRAYPSDPSRTYSSDPSQYSTPNQPRSEEPSKIYTTEPLDTARIAGDDKRSADNQKRRERETFEGKTRQTSSNSNRKDDFYTYATSNREHMIVYILLALGLLILLFVNNLLGGLMIGMVAGYYFAEDIVYYIRNLGQIVKGQDHLRYVISAALLLGLFIAAPGIFIGAIVVATFRQVISGPRG
jgi:hypothetical protein